MTWTIAKGSSSNVGQTATYPGVPTIGVATAGAQSASVTFTPPASTGGSGISAYTATSSPGGFTGISRSSPVVVHGLNVGTPYTFTVRSTNVIGDSAESAASNSVTPTALTHGDQITLGNTGYTAFHDSTLARRLVLADLDVIDGNHWISDFVAAGDTIRRKHFTGGVVVDVNNVTFEACLFDQEVGNIKNGIHASGTQFNYCTVYPPIPNSECVAHQGYSAYRCVFRGCSDGLKINGGGSVQEIVECYIRVTMESQADHNDGLQNVGGAGTVNIRRCNISNDPESGLLADGLYGGPNGAIMSADFAFGAAAYHLNVEDCLIKQTQGGYTIRFYDGHKSSLITYRAVGNKHVRPGSNQAEIHRGIPETPLSQIEWSNNRWADDGELIPMI